MSLATLAPVVARQTYRTLERIPAPGPGAKPAIAGQRFEHGLRTYSEGELVYDIPAGAVRFQAAVGVDDRGNPPNPAVPAQVGSVTFAVQTIP